MLSKKYAVSFTCDVFRSPVCWVTTVCAQLGDDDAGTEA